MVRDQDGPWALRDLLDPVTKRVGLDAGVASGVVWARWQEIVGADIASHAEPTSLRGGVLRVRTESPAWATEIGYLADELKRRVNETLNRVVVSEVRVWTGPGVIRPPQPVPPPVARSGASEASSRSARDDPQGAFRRAYEAWRARRQKRPQEGSSEVPESKESPW